MLKYFLVVFGAALAMPAFARENYLCKTEASAGFSFDKQLRTWSPTSFQAGRKFIFRQKQDDDNKTMPWAWTWALFPFGSTEACAVCGKDFELSDYTQECSGIYDFAFNRKTLRFQIYYKFGFTFSSTKDGVNSGELEGNDTPFVLLGHVLCSRAFPRSVSALRVTILNAANPDPNFYLNSITSNCVDCRNS